jgi:hypothetical protein
MKNILEPNQVEWRICAYVIREGRPASSSEIKDGLKLASLYWAEYYLYEMVQMGLLDKREGDKYHVPEDVKWNFLISYFTYYQKRVVQRFHFYISFVLTLSLIYAYYFIYLPRNINTNHLFATTFALFSILMSLIEVINLLRVRRELGV